MKTAFAIEKAGSQALLAELLGITSSAITQWGDAIPQARVWQLRVMRPHWFHAIEGNQPAALDGQALGAITGQGV